MYYSSTYNVNICNLCVLCVYLYVLYINHTVFLCYFYVLSVYFNAGSGYVRFFSRISHKMWWFEHHFQTFLALYYQKAISDTMSATKCQCKICQPLRIIYQPQPYYQSTSVYILSTFLYYPATYVYFSETYIVIACNHRVLPRYLLGKTWLLFQYFLSTLRGGIWLNHGLWRLP